MCSPVALVSSCLSKQVGWGVDGGVKYWKALTSEIDGLWMRVNWLFKADSCKIQLPGLL